MKKIISGLALSAVLLGAPLAFAQTTTGSTTYTTTGSASTTASTTPGVPNTGAGGDAAQNLLLLGISAAVALAGIAYLSARARTTVR